MSYISYASIAAGTLSVGDDMSSYHFALVKQQAMQLMESAVDDAVEQVIDQHLDAVDDYLDPFNRLRLKKRLLKSVSDRIETHAEQIAAETVRRAYG